MAITTLSSREFNQDRGRAKKASTRGPVFITDRGRPSHVLLNIEEYRKLSGERPRSLLDFMDSIPGGDFDFDPPRLNANMGFKIPDFED